MDAYVQLALIEKSKRVFATDASTFLGFPLLSPLTYKPQSLAALSSPATAADYVLCGRFRPGGEFPAARHGGQPRWRPLSLGRLWRRDDPRRSRGRGTGGAGSNMTSLLYDVAADGTRTESAAYATYRQYRDAWFVARENYGAHKLTGEAATDPDEKQELDRRRRTRAQGRSSQGRERLEDAWPPR